MGNDMSPIYLDFHIVRKRLHEFQSLYYIKLT
jgi:hypothetical protein